MISLKFSQKLRAATRRNRSFLCLGLDPDPDLMPHQHVPSFVQEIVDATADLVCAYKPNLAFFEALGIGGMQTLLEAVRSIPSHVPIIADAKRGDIGNSSRFYARAIFDEYEFDAATVNPWGGRDSVMPFIDYAEKGVFIWCRGSNAGAADFQDLTLADGRTVYEAVAEKASEWNESGNVGLVAGASYPDEIERVRAICPDMPILIPGVGAQRGQVTAAVRSAMDVNGEGMIINASRSILYAARDDGYAKAARRAAQALRDEINLAREKLLDGR